MNGDKKQKPKCTKYRWSKEWFLNNKLHRIDGPAIEHMDGDKEWFLNGKRHREDGPAAEWGNGDKEWWLNGYLHRIDGPAIDYVDSYKAWYLNGEEYTKRDYYRELVQRGLCTEQEAFLEML